MKKSCESAAFCSSVSHFPSISKFTCSLRQLGEMLNSAMSLWFIAAFTAYFVKGLCGVANTLIFTTILSFVAVNANISPVDLLLGYPANLILTCKNRRSLDTKVFLPLAILVLAGSIPRCNIGYLVWTIRSGALLAVYVSRITENDESFKTNISAVFIVDNGFRIILYKTLGFTYAKYCKISFAPHSFCSVWTVYGHEVLRTVE